jgi:hypothetical protein
VRDAIWSYWSAPGGRQHSARWSSSFHHLLSWAISTSAEGLRNSTKVLYTDSEGARLLVDEMALPFDEVRCVFDVLPLELSRFWALGKLCAYRQHSEPFVHLDSDVYLWKPLPARLEAAALFSQNPERFEFGRAYYDPCAFIEIIERDGGYVPDELKWYLSLRGNEACCCGIFGGNRTDFIEQYASQAMDLVLKNSRSWQRLPQEIEPNVIVEQYLLTAMCYYSLAHGTDRGARMEYLFRSEDESTSTASSRLAGYTHLIGNAKRDPEILDRLAAHARKHLPESYVRAERISRSLLQ